MKADSNKTTEFLTHAVTIDRRPEFFGTEAK
jgi:hypothetical protein